MGELVEEVEVANRAEAVAKDEVVSIATHMEIVHTSAPTVRIPVMVTSPLQPSLTYKVAPLEVACEKMGQEIR